MLGEMIFQKKKKEKFEDCYPIAKLNFENSFTKPIQVLTLQEKQKICNPSLQIVKNSPKHLFMLGLV